MRVAAAQIECRPGDIAWNLALHLAVIEEARERGADLVVFPELSLTDYISEPDVAALAMTPDDEPLRRIATAARGMVVSVGFIERSASGQVHNAQALLGFDALLQVHRKVNLPTYGRLVEGKFYAPGRSLEPVSLSVDWKAVTLVCADIWNPALPWLAALQGADILLVPAASSLHAVGDGFSNPNGWDINLRHTALTYGLPIVMVNHCGARGGLDFWGGSRILDAFGDEVARAGREPGLIVANLNAADGERARRRLPTIRDADPDLVHDMLGDMLGRSRPKD